MIAGDQLHRPSDASAGGTPPIAGRAPTATDPRGLEASGSQSPLTWEFTCALGGGVALLVLALLLYTLAAWLGTGLTVYGEQFVGLLLAGALGTGVAREFAFNTR